MFLDSSVRCPPEYPGWLIFFKAGLHFRVVVSMFFCNSASFESTRPFLREKEEPEKDRNPEDERVERVERL